MDGVGIHVFVAEYVVILSGWPTTIDAVEL